MGLGRHTEAVTLVGTTAQPLIQGEPCCPVSSVCMGEQVVRAGGERVSVECVCLCWRARVPAQTH